MTMRRLPVEPSLPSVLALLLSTKLRASSAGCMTCIVIERNPVLLVAAFSW